MGYRLAIMCRDNSKISHLCDSIPKAAMLEVELHAIRNGFKFRTNIELPKVACYSDLYVVHLI